MLCLVTYDLKSPGKNYEPLYDEIKHLGQAWWHYMESVWLIQTNVGLDECNNRLRQLLDNNDLLLIVNITGQPRQGWLPAKAWDWIRTHND